MFRIEKQNEKRFVVQCCDICGEPIRLMNDGVVVFPIDCGEDLADAEQLWEYYSESYTVHKLSNKSCANVAEAMLNSKGKSAERNDVNLISWGFVLKLNEGDETQKKQKWDSFFNSYIL